MPGKIAQDYQRKKKEEGKKTRGFFFRGERRLVTEKGRTNRVENSFMLMKIEIGKGGTYRENEQKKEITQV